MPNTHIFVVSCVYIGRGY